MMLLGASSLYVLTATSQESDADDTDEDEKRDALLGAKNLVNEIARSKKGRKKRKGLFSYKDCNHLFVIINLSKFADAN